MGFEKNYNPGIAVSDLDIGVGGGSVAVVAIAIVAVVAVVAIVAVFAIAVVVAWGW